MNISETSGPIVIEFHQEHYWGGGLVALCFGPYQMRTGFHGNSFLRVIMGKNLVTTLAPSFLIVFSLFLQVKRTTIRSWIGLKFGKIQPGTYELAAL